MTFANSQNWTTSNSPNIHTDNNIESISDFAKTDPVMKFTASCPGCQLHSPAGKVWPQAVRVLSLHCRRTKILHRECEHTVHTPILQVRSSTIWSYTCFHGQWNELIVFVIFSLSLSSKPFTYGICLNELGHEVVHKYVSHEPSGRNFNEICLDSQSKAESYGAIEIVL